MRALGGGVEPLAEQRAGLVDAGRVDEHDLGVGPGEHAHDAGAGGLRLVRDDGHLRAEDLVEQRGLAHVGPAHERHEAGAHQRPPARSAGTGSKASHAVDAHPPDAAALHPLRR